MAIVPMISVIIPHLNEPDELRRCLASLVAQRTTDIPCEIIVVDNGSAQPPTGVCADFDGVKLEVELVPGPGPARNRGAAVAQGEILAFIDCDCIAGSRWIEYIVSFFARNPDVDFVGGDIRIQPAQPERLTAIEAYESVFSYRNDRYVTEYAFSATGNMAVRAKVFAAVGPFGGIGTMEDTDWGMKASAEGYRIAYLDEAKVYTPPCASLGELLVRWDRHVAHEFRKLGPHVADNLMWALKSVAVALSPLAETITVFRTRRIRTLRARVLAFAVLVCVRLHRARRMIGFLLSDNTSSTVGKWNRENT